MKVLMPQSMEEVLACLRDAQGEARVLAGGTDLVVQMRSGRRQPGTLVDIKRIEALARIERDASGAWNIGCAVCAADITEHARLRAEYPGFVEAVGLIGSMQVQGRATPVGNLCNASPAADSMPAAIAAGAMLTVIASGGARTIPVESLVIGPGRTCLQADEFVSAIQLPARAGFSADAYLRLTPRAEMDIAVVGVGVNLTLDAHGTCTAARVGLGAVASRALLVPAASAALVGTRLDAKALQKFAQAVEAACAPIDDKRGTAEYRRQMAPVIAKRTAECALQRTRARKTT